MGKTPKIYVSRFLTAQTGKRKRKPILIPVSIVAGYYRRYRSRLLQMHCHDVSSGIFAYQSLDTFNSDHGLPYASVSPDGEFTSCNGTLDDVSMVYRHFMFGATHNRACY